MVYLYRTQFISLPYSFINWFLYDENVDGYEIYFLLIVEQYMFRVAR